jgi:hypothetical protein
MLPERRSDAAPASFLAGAEDQPRLWNAAKLTVSLVVTWSIGLVVRFSLPRYLGPERLAG